MWRIDNIAALMALVKGSSRVFSLDQTAKAIHLGAFALESQAYYEYVESKANWSDEISRLGSKGHWAARNHFDVRHCGVAEVLRYLPCIAIVKVLPLLLISNSRRLPVLVHPAAPLLQHCHLLFVV